MAPSYVEVTSSLQNCLAQLISSLIILVLIMSSPASNTVGEQQKPCVYHIILAVSPEPVDNCTVINKSSETFHLQVLSPA